MTDQGPGYALSGPTPNYGPGNPDYGQPRYGQQPQYDQQYGQQPLYGPPPQSAGAAPGSGGGGPRKGLFLGLAAVVVAAGVALILVVAGVFSSSSSGSTPTAAVKKLLDAGTTGDVSAAKSVLCQADLADGTADEISKTSNRVKSYSIDSVQQDGDTATVTATITSSDTGGPQTEPVPVIKEGGSWKVCFSRDLAFTPGAGSGALSALPSGGFGAGGGPTEPALPSTFPSLDVPSALLPSGLIPSGLVPSGVLDSFCASSTSALTTAETYIGAVEIGSAEVAQACVYHDSVPSSTTQGLTAGSDYYSLASDSSTRGPDFDFMSISGSKHIHIATTKESDGMYYVTGVSTS